MGVAILDYRVPVDHYPTDYFGDYVENNLLVVYRKEFSDEASLRRFFLSVTKAIARADEDWLYFLLDRDPQTEIKIDDFRTEGGFVPEAVLEFAGKTPVRVEINFNAGQALIQSGERWEVYEMEPAGASALENLIYTARPNPTAMQPGS